jgi:hypothetical protein
VAFASIGISAGEHGTAPYSYAWKVDVRRSPGLIGHHDIYGSGRSDQGKMLARQIVGAENEPARDAIQFDERQRGGQLVPRCDEY